VFFVRRIWHALLDVRNSDVRSTVEERPFQGRVTRLRVNGASSPGGRISIRHPVIAPSTAHERYRIDWLEIRNLGGRKKRIIREDPRKFVAK
jgi:hypothetical protein